MIDTTLIRKRNEDADGKGPDEMSEEELIRARRVLRMADQIEHRTARNQLSN